MSIPFSNVDYNIFKYLSLILRHKSVTIAAQKAGVTQPAMSHTLKKARLLYDDPLLIMRGKESYLSEKARKLEVYLSQLMIEIEDKILTVGEFDPRTSRRSFTILSNGHFDLTYLPKALAILKDEAPEVSLKTRPFNANQVESLLESSQAQLAFGVSGMNYSFLMQRTLGKDSFLCAMCESHPLANGETLRLEDYLRFPHILVNPRGEGRGVVDEILSSKNKSRNIRLQTSDFTSAVLLLKNSDLILTGPKSFLISAQSQLSIKTYKPPIAIRKFSYKCFWHEKDAKDAGIAWLRTKLCDLMAETNA